MGDAADELRPVFAQGRQELVMRIALMQEDRFAHLHREVELVPERRDLGRSRREVAKVVESALADRHDFRLRGEGCELRQRRLVEVSRVMRMNARCAPESLRIAADQFDCRARAGQRAAGDHHARHAGSRSPPDHFGAIGVETVVGEIDADVDELSGQRADLRCGQPVLSFDHEL